VESRRREQVDKLLALLLRHAVLVRAPAARWLLPPVFLSEDQYALPRVRPSSAPRNVTIKHVVDLTTLGLWVAGQGTTHAQIMRRVVQRRADLLEDSARAAGKPRPSRSPRVQEAPQTRWTGQGRPAQLADDPTQGQAHARSRSA
jgi:hypothetical protein